MKSGFLTDDDEQILCQEKMIQELVKGKESATQLKNLLMLQQSFKINGGDGSSSSSVDELTVKILNSFTQTLSMAMTSFSGSNSNQIISANNGGGDRSNRNILPLQNTTTNKRRGCYKRRNTTETGIQVSATMVDGYAWRKYGQKDIHNSDYPRCYYRCTHKYDQGCKATKQVQKIPQEDSHPYQTTYFGHHTCNKDASSSRVAPEIISEIVPIDSYLMSFESKLIKPDTFSSTTIINPTTDTSTQSDASAHGYRGNDISSAAATASLWEQDIGSNYYHEEVVSSIDTMDDDMVDFYTLVDLENSLYFDENDFS